MTLSRRRIIVGVAALAAIVGVLYLAAAFRSGATAAPGTTVGGVDVGGMTRSEAIQAVEATLAPAAAKKLRVTALDQTFVLKPEEAGLGLDAAASVAPIYGRSWNPFDLIGRFFSSHELPVLPAVDDAALSAQLSSMAQTIDVPAQEPTVVVEDGEPILTPGVAGRALDQQATADALKKAVLQPRVAIQATIVEVDPQVSTADADAAVALGRTAIAAPVTVQAQTITADIPTKALARALSFTESDGTLVPMLDGHVLHHSIRKELKPIEVKGRDATFKIRHGLPKVVKSKVGTGVADDELATAVAAVLDKPAGERNVTVSVGTREPKLTTDEAKALGVTERMSTFTQHFPYAAYRVQNIGEAAKRINGTILMPGETFSLNDTLKERTEKNGYTIGFVVGEGGVFAEELGGGVSTSATATWTAAFYAGLERVQTIAHSIYISRYRPGLEATVAWGIFDMKFRNDTPNAVFITSGITNESITVSMWGTKVYDDIEAESGPEKNIRKYQTIYDTSKDCLGQGGVNGFSITVDRVFYKGGKEVAREPITTSYKPAPEVICHKKPDKGTKPGKGGDDAGTGDVVVSPSPVASPGPAASGPPADVAPAGDDANAANPKPSKSPKPGKTPKPDKTPSPSSG